MFKGKITYDSLSLHYPPSVAQFLIEEIEKAALISAAANQDGMNDMRGEVLEHPVHLAQG